MATAVSVAGILLSGGQTGCNADFLSRFSVTITLILADRKKRQLYTNALIIYDYF